MAVYNLAISYYRTAQYDKAIKRFKELENASLNWSNSNKCDYYQWIGICYGNINGRVHDANYYLQKAEMVASTDEELYENITIPVYFIKMGIMNMQEGMRRRL